jgi:RHS repeat-associated protein
MRRTRDLALAAALLGPAAGLHAQVIEYAHLDALGSVRAITDAAGRVLERHDYLPYGEEWNPAPPRPETLTQRYTGKERDLETALDYFGARYYGARLARFTTVDPVMNVKANLMDPQRWNRYAYVLGNPLRNVDPDGREPVKNQIGSAAAAARVIAKAGITKLTPQLAEANHNPFRGVPGRRGGPGASVRYVAAGKVSGGFIDMQHFLAAAAKAHEIGYGHLGLAAASWGGVGLEVSQLWRGYFEDNPGLLKSAFSYEDIPSNDAGAVFAAYYYDENEPLGPQVEAFLNDRAQAVTPQELKTKHAERYRRLPASEKAAQAEYDKP